jgi:hypothetical protein
MKPSSRQQRSNHSCCRAHFSSLHCSSSIASGGKADSFRALIAQSSAPARCPAGVWGEFDKHSRLHAIRGMISNTPSGPPVA